MKQNADKELYENKKKE